MAAVELTKKRCSGKMKKQAIKKIAIPPTNPPSDSTFPCPYVCSASGGFIAIFAAKSKTMVTILSNNA